MTKHKSSTTVCDHTSVGILVEQSGNLLLIERKRPPFGFAPPAGHVDDHGSFESAARNELKEEVGLQAEQMKLMAEGRKENPCRRAGGTWHYWKIYSVVVSGRVKASQDETKSFIWCSRAALAELSQRTKEYLTGNISETQWIKNPGLEPVWHEWLKHLGYFDDK